MSQETGAAIHLASNCNGLLRRMGLFAEDLGAVECTTVKEFLPHTAEMKYTVDAKRMGDKLWTHPWHLAHRAHLHTALRNMATDSDRKGAPAKLHLACRVKSVDPESATITLEDGSEFHGDLLIGADGVHSRTRASIPGGDKKPFDSGKSAFRFLIPTETLKADPRIAGYITPSTLTMWIGEDRRLVMYPCMDNTQMNFVCIHPSKESEVEGTNEAGKSYVSSCRYFGEICVRPLTLPQIGRRPVVKKECFKSTTASTPAANRSSRKLNSQRYGNCSIWIKCQRSSTNAWP